MMPGKDMFIGVFISASLERKNYFSSVLGWIIWFQSVIFSYSKRFCLLWESLQYSGFIFSGEKKSSFLYSLVDTSHKNSSMWTHSSNLFRRSDGANSWGPRATKENMLFLVTCRDYHLPLQWWPFFGDISSLWDLLQLSQWKGLRRSGKPS